MTEIAALYVETNGEYFARQGVDPWDVVRDAREYKGPLSVVAHPPCQLWVNFAALNFKRYGGEHNRPGNDGGCFAAALASVREWGGGCWSIPPAPTRGQRSISRSRARSVGCEIVGSVRAITNGRARFGSRLMATRHASEHGCST